MQKAFVLGAGLGTRLRPLTDQLPKPLIPVFHQPLISHAFEHLLGIGVGEFVVNTHHLPETYAQAFPLAEYHGAPIHFRHESPERLETAGGIANVRDLLGDEPFLVYNGDILTDIPLQRLLHEHHTRGNIVTLALRSHGPALHIALDEQSGLITDIRNQLGTGQTQGKLFTGVYICQPEFHEWLTPGKTESVIPVFLRMIQAGARLGGVVIDEGRWWDLGTRSAYLEAHRALHESGHGPAIHPDAHISPDVVLTGLNVIGPGVVIESGVMLENCLLWPQAHITAGAYLTHCIVRQGISVQGRHVDMDL